MSDHSICLFPTDPHYVPDEPAQERAVELLEAVVRGIVGPDWPVKVTAKVTEHVDVILPMENLGEPWCPACISELDLDLWDRTMGEVYAREEGFDGDLSATMPCCGAVRSIADIIFYPQPVGFARFRIEAHGIRGWFEESNVARLENDLGCRLRQTWIWS